MWSRCLSPRHAHLTARGCLQITEHAHQPWVYFIVRFRAWFSWSRGIFFFFNVTAVACRCLQASVLTAPGPSIGPTSQTEVSWPPLLTLWCFPVFLSTSAPISKD